tara:strand:- start:897 stop:1859 length:963 start_codon:yes stop_codon:yes gene_type:complete
MTETTHPPATLTLRDRKEMLLQELRERWDAEIAPIVPAHINESRLCGLMSAAFTTTPKLLKCHAMTMLDSIVTLFQLGLTPNSSALGHGWILPYADKAIAGESGGHATHRAVAIIGYKGWLQLASQAGNIKSIDARAVYLRDVEEDRFEIGTSDGTPFVRYNELAVDDGSGRDDSDIVGAYCHITGLDGRVAQVWLPRWKLDKLEPKRGGRGAWASNREFPTRYAGMVRKTTIRAIFNQGMWPLETERLARALDHEAQVDELDKVTALPLPEDAERPRTDQLFDDLVGKSDEGTPAPGPDFSLEDAQAEDSKARPDDTNG